MKSQRCISSSDQTNSTVSKIVGNPESALRRTRRRVSRWIPCKPGFFLPVRVLSRLFRRLFLERLQHAFDRDELRFSSSLIHLSEPAQFGRYISGLKHTEWVVYAKQPLGGPQQVLDYLGRYTHRVAISNNRLASLTDEHVTFRWKDSRHPGRLRAMRLDAHKFIGRFLLHVLPRELQRIRRLT